MDLYSKPIGNISYPDIEAFVAQRHPESKILDYKQDWKDLKRVMAAFANTDGGIILLGVGEEDKTGMPVVPAIGIDVTSGEDAIRATVDSMAYDGVYPPLFPEVRVCRKNDDLTKAVVLIRMNESHETPHATDSRQRIYVRVGSQNRFEERQATLEELEWLWARRRAAVELREFIIRRARDRADVVRSSFARKSADAGQPAKVLPIASAAEARKEPEVATVEAYSVLAHPDHPRVPPDKLQRFALDTSTPIRVRDSSYRSFPVGSGREVRSVADGTMAICRVDSELIDNLQLDHWGTVYNQLYVRPRIKGNARVFFAQNLMASVEAFLCYAGQFHSEFALRKPLLVSIRVQFPSGSHMRSHDDECLVYDSEVQLMKDMCLPNDLARCSHEWAEACAVRVLWAGGFGSQDMSAVRSIVESFLGSDR